MSWQIEEAGYTTAELKEARIQCSLTLLHGTNERAARLIMQGGFRPSISGMLGRGVYLTPDPRKARAYGNFMLECKASVGEVICITYKEHPMQKDWACHGFHTARVPPRCGMVASGLEELCVS